MEKVFAPVALFVFKRLDCLKITIERLALNKGADQTELYIFSDGPRSEQETFEVERVRKYVAEVSGFKRVVLVSSDKNKGLAKSVIDGVSSVVSKFGRVIVLEDDLVTSSNFLTYMNDALTFYEKASNVLSICGYSSPIKTQYDQDIYFSHRSSSWGWATWLDRWEKVDWEVRDFKSFVNSSEMSRNFNQMGSDLTYMLKKQMAGKINSWAIRFCYHQYKNKLYSVHPIISKVENIGIQNGATHTMDDRFKTVLDSGNKLNFSFDGHPKLNSLIIKDFLKPYSLFTRLKYKVLNTVQSQVSFLK